MLENAKPVQGLSEAFTFDRDVTFSLREKKLLYQTAFGVKRPCNVGKKVLAMGRVLEILFVACARALAWTSGTKRWPTHFIVTQIFNRSRESVGERLLNIIALCNPQLLKTSDRCNPSEELHKTRLCLRKLWAKQKGGRESDVRRINCEELF